MGMFEEWQGGQNSYRGWSKGESDERWDQGDNEGLDHVIITLLPQPPIECKAKLKNGVRNFSPTNICDGSTRKICIGQNSFPHIYILLLLLSLSRVVTTRLSDAGPTGDQALFVLGGSRTGRDWPNLFPDGWGWDQAAYLHPVGKNSGVVIHQIHCYLELVLSLLPLYFFLS